MRKGKPLYVQFFSCLCIAWVACFCPDTDALEPMGAEPELPVPTGGRGVFGLFGLGGEEFHCREERERQNTYV